MKGCIILSGTFILFAIFNLDVDAVCTGLPVELQGSTWEDSVTKQTFTFGTKTLKGFSFSYIGTSFKDFTCTGNTDNVYVFGSDNSHSSPTGSAEYFYLCMRIIKVTHDLFYYYLLAGTNSGTIPNVRAISSTVTQTVASTLSTCHFFEDITSDESFLQRSDVNGSGTPVTADALCLPCTKTQAECYHSGTSMGTSSSSPMDWWEILLIVLAGIALSMIVAIIIRHVYTHHKVSKIGVQK
ncbi:uncharacterized protein LOC143048575 isoform X1 [Mytilus galloprovincialis]|uniref:uncharacterized protein LOC143048575 isoform X1 n=1 Tax=Mytilus galloprovincialis TaxID=29158 RepID=UPI003F7B529D